MFVSHVVIRNYNLNKKLENENSEPPGEHTLKPKIIATRNDIGLTEEITKVTSILLPSKISIF